MTTDLLYMCYEWYRHVVYSCNWIHYVDVVMISLLCGICDNIGVCVCGNIGICVYGNIGACVYGNIRVCVCGN